MPYAKPQTPSSLSRGQHGSEPMNRNAGTTIIFSSVCLIIPHLLVVLDVRGRIDRYLVLALSEVNHWNLRLYFLVVEKELVQHRHHGTGKEDRHAPSLPT